MADWVGRTLSKVYIERMISRGGMAEVYIARHTTLNRLVAVKILHSYLSDDPTLNDRFRAEAQGVAMLRHSNIVQVFDFDIAEDQPYIIMEALDGPTLAEYLRVLHASGGRMPLPMIARFTAALASALDYAHTRGIIHRDIKPANIILRSEAGRPVPRPPKSLPDDVAPVLTDFGLARMVNSPLVSNSGTITGTPAYMSPEQARSDRIGSHSDIYSLGVIVYELLAGQPPFRGDTPARLIFEHISQAPPPMRRVRDDLPESVEAVVLRALAKNPEDRFNSAGEMAESLAAALNQTLLLDTGAAPPQRPAPASIAATADTPVPGKLPVTGVLGGQTAIGARLRRSRPGLALAALILGSLVVGAFGLALISGDAGRLLGLAPAPTLASGAASLPGPAASAIDVSASQTPRPTLTAPPTAPLVAEDATLAPGTVPGGDTPEPPTVAPGAETGADTPTPEPSATPTFAPTPFSPFLDDFGQPLDEDWTEVRGNMGLALGRLTLRDLVQGQVNEGVALIAQRQWRDVSVEAEIKNVASSDLNRFLAPGSAATALLIRAAPDGTGLGLVIERTAIQFAVLDAEGNWTLLGGTRANQGLIFDVGRVVRVEAVGNLYRAFVGGEEASSIEYRGPLQGQVGAWFRSVLVTGLDGQTVPQIENIDVRPLPPASPTPMPAAVSDSFADNFDEGLQPQWTIYSGGFGMARSRLTLTRLLPSQATLGLMGLDGLTWSQARVEARISDLSSFSDEAFLFEGNSAVALLTRLQADGRAVGVIVERRALTLAARGVDGEWTPLPGARVTGMDFTAPHLVQLVASGTTYTVYLDRVQVLSTVYNDGPAEGTVGVWVRSAIPINPADPAVVPKLDDFRASGQP